MKVTKTLLWTVLILVSVFFMDTLVYAQEPLMPLAVTGPMTYYGGHPTYLDSINAENYGKENFPTTKLGYGVINIGTSWIDIPERVVDVSHEKDLLQGFTLGLGEGIVSGVTRAAAGSIDMATFMFPPYEKPLMEPDYTADNPQKDGLKIKILTW
ncbi:MAG: exosortase system-associated protein, TIGR04073 family [Candidatus Omnitrophica bacterium]|nr:exosortase system-associated protein, TIGR04073 family [Candidatus Omnitrophota bacterium]